MHLSILSGHTLCLVTDYFQNVIVLSIVKTEFLSRSFLTMLSQGLITYNMKTEVNKESELKINLGFLEFLKLPLPSLDINWYNVPSSWWSDSCQMQNSAEGTVTDHVENFSKAYYWTWRSVFICGHQITVSWVFEFVD